MSYFESATSATFEYQVDVFAMADILLSPHGGQLAGLPFMPPCAQVIELYPVAFLIPAYFGSLASISGVNHTFFYTGFNDHQARANELRSVGNSVSRVRNLTPNITKLVRGVREVIENWRTCCETLKLDKSFASSA